MQARVSSPASSVFLWKTIYNLRGFHLNAIQGARISRYGGPPHVCPQNIRPSNILVITSQATNVAKSLLACSCSFIDETAS